MTLFIDGHSYHYEMECLCRMFFFYQKIEVVHAQVPSGESYVYTGVSRGEDTTQLRVRVRLGEQAQCEEAQVENVRADYDSFCEKELARMVYRILSGLTGTRLGWGILTGIRPVRLVHSFWEQGKCDEEIRQIFERDYYASPQKTQLAITTAYQEKQIISRSQRNSFSLYVSIPFCPSRCRYCSFVSHSIEKTKKLMEPYVEHLCQELRLVAHQVKQLGLRLETVYFGGGTPTTLTAQQLTTLFDTIREQFDLSHLQEYTVEAGRPDTITPEKLQAIKSAGITRISINPQTLSDSVLQEIGRKHTTQQTLRAFALARKLGFDNINMDLIAGLPGDTYESFVETIEGVLKLGPENVTLHTLSVKRAADLARQPDWVYRQQHETVAAMLEYAYQRFEEQGLRPYYLYRQKNTMGNMENVGFCKPGKEGLYNVYIMDETHSILAVGAGGVTKLRQPGGTYLQRIFNFKYPYEYLSRFDDILTRKGQVPEFYERYKDDSDCPGGGDQ